MSLPPRLFCDTSFFYACLDPADASHPHAVELIDQADRSRSDFLTTWDIVSETATLLRYRCSLAAALTFLGEIQPTLELVHYSDESRAAAMEVFRDYGQDRRLSLCDALSFVVVTTLLKDLPCLAFDRDFRALGLTVLA